LIAGRKKLSRRDRLVAVAVAGSVGTQKVGRWGLAGTGVGSTKEKRSNHRFCRLANREQQYRGTIWSQIHATSDQASPLRKRDFK
jgi:hypothetical protein